MLNLLKRLVREEEGQGMIEYALIAALISIVAIVTIGLVSDDVSEMWTDLQAGTADGAAATP